MIRPPPRSPPFPYTPLSRARHRGAALHALEPLPARLRALERLPERSAALDAAHFGDAEGGRRRDRKSTRLNSSHANISYAVFCLKKTNSSHANMSYAVFCLT